MALHSFNKKLNIIPYFNIDGVAAFSNHQLDEVHINLESATSFFNLAAINEQEKTFAKHEKEVIEVSDFWLDTLAHELVHIQEATFCQSTHDPLFDRKLVQNKNKFLFKTNQRSNAIDILEDVLRH
jgi:hypothetical protein